MSQNRVPSGPGRPRGDEERAETVAMGTKVTLEQAAAFEELAAENGRTKSSQLRELVEIYLDVHAEGD